MTGIEPASPAWEAGVLPMNYICVSIYLAEILPANVIIISHLYEIASTFLTNSRLQFASNSRLFLSTFSALGCTQMQILGHSLPLRIHAPGCDLLLPEGRPGPYRSPDDSRRHSPLKNIRPSLHTLRSAHPGPSSSDPGLPPRTSSSWRPALQP